MSEVPEAAAEAEPETGAPTASTGRPAHRPSRRSEIVRAATNVFSRLTYAEATVEDIASERWQKRCVKSPASCGRVFCTRATR